MVTESELRYLLSDHESLLEFMRGCSPTFKEVKMRLFLIHRDSNRNMPDHYCHLSQEKNFQGIDSLSKLIRVGLYRLAKEHLELRDNRIYVKGNKQNEWQELLTYIPPLILQMAFLHIEKPLCDRKPETLRQYYLRYILPNTRYTALPHAYINQLEDYLKQEEGLYDLHIHLNGSSETDIIWQDSLSSPNEVYEKFKLAFEDLDVEAQIEQEFFHGKSTELKKLFVLAKIIRQYFFGSVFNICCAKPDWLETLFRAKSFQDLLEKINSFAEEGGIEPSLTSYTNPFASLVYPNDNVKESLLHPISVEGLMYIVLFNFLSGESREALSSMLYYYIQIYGLINRLLVQQVHQFGFDQFQKITKNDLRAFNEDSSYLKRFFQLHGNELRNISVLEGRFSPKKNSEEMLDILSKIDDGWNKFLKRLALEDYRYESTFKQVGTIGKNDKLFSTNQYSLSRRQPQLNLTAHFIKKNDKDLNTDIRHKRLRYDLWNRAKTLALFKKNYPNQAHRIVGVDAAANELETPPEVFSPIFRYLRRNGIKHFTYHAGEDFFHIIGGLRAIYEAVDFNAMECGDRIGHATACGISPALWLKNVGDEIWVRKGDYLDDLLFVYFLIVNEKCTDLESHLLALRSKILDLAFEIYHENYMPEIHLKAWHLRRFCPGHLLSDYASEDVTMLAWYDDVERCEIHKAVASMKHNDAIELVKKYNSSEVKQCYKEIILVDTLEFFSCEELEVLQRLVLEFLHRKEVVIETLPSSNVRISHYKNMDEYHLWNWIRWQKAGHPIPPIVIGTDDPGIFATNIYSECANIYCNLTTKSRLSHNEAMEIIKQLNGNAKIYAFR
ncbi:hypothetical protein QYZ87_08855 [Porphyromonadaceae bacterium W3.11]|nr:hypothetical protein [Porphyromonadaceae bacterium W3.11]